jgi:secondary thiamine-phosphate synthase enzyme
MKDITVVTRGRTEFVPITDLVRRAADELGIRDGAVTVFVPHTTAGITINENADPDVVRDMAAALERMVPWDAGYAHEEGNAAAHVKASLMGSSVRVPVEGGRLRLGTWQGVYFCEFDGPRTRQVWVQEG